MPRKEGSGMTISAYQADNVIKAYQRQSKIRHQSDVQTTSSERFADVVIFSGEDAKTAAFKKISYTLMDILLSKKDDSQDKKPKPTV
jgi:hypothetical protein